MSLVLEALKKQEAGSDPGAAVSLARQADQRRRQRLWMCLFAAAMALNAAVLLWVFGLPLLQEPDVLSRGPAAAQPSPAADPGPAAPRESAAPVGAQPQGPASPDRTPVADAGIQAPEPAASAPKPARPQPASPPAPVRIRLGDLPPAARARFPGIAFSTHIYADDADLRAIVANGQRLEEGDRIRGLEILEITESGVVLGFERYAVEVPLGGDWET